MTNEIKKSENVFEFIKVTEHYGYKLEIEQNGGLPRFVIYRIGKQEKISAFVEECSACRECKYLEKLNFSK